MEKLFELTNLYIASLRSLYLIHQHGHWTTKGLTFYGDHLLFERLYKQASEDADIAAEKMIGLFGESAFDYVKQFELIGKIGANYAKYEGNPIKMSLAIVADFIKLSKQFYDYLESENKMTLGLDDLIMNLANKQEESSYLLNQALK
jgi:DNA-binding ferritin-like protein